MHVFAFNSPANAFAPLYRQKRDTPPAALLLFRGLYRGHALLFWTVISKIWRTQPTSRVKLMTTTPEALRSGRLDMAPVGLRLFLGYTLLAQHRPLDCQSGGSLKVTVSATYPYTGDGGQGGEPWTTGSGMRLPREIPC